MITAVDTNVLLDVFGADPVFGTKSAAAVRASLHEGALIACEVVWAEVAAMFSDPADARDALDRLGVGFSPIQQDAALAAGAAWKLYRGRGGRRVRVVADFLIGAHALGWADRLLTRDRGLYQSYFKELLIIDPSK